MRSTPGTPRERRTRMRVALLDPAVVVGGVSVVRLLLDRPPDDVDQRRERDLERQHQP
jgi:hypothetical protein